MNPYVKTELFLDLYKQLEKAGRKHFPDVPESAPIITRISGLSMLREFKEDIEYCRVVRNFLVHTPRIKGMYPVLPSDDMIELLKTCIERLKSPAKAMDYAIKAKNMFTATLDSKITFVTDYMNRYGFTHVPVLDENQRLIGVFSDNAIYSYICAKGTIHIGENTTLNDICEFLPIHTHTPQLWPWALWGATLWGPRQPSPSTARGCVPAPRPSGCWPFATTPAPPLSWVWWEQAFLPTARWASCSIWSTWPAPAWWGCSFAFTDPKRSRELTQRPPRSRPNALPPPLPRQSPGPWAPPSTSAPLSSSSPSFCACCLWRDFCPPWRRGLGGC